MLEFITKEAAGQNTRKKELEKEKAVKEQNERKLKEVEQQQADFGEKK